MNEYHPQLLNSPGALAGSSWRNPQLPGSDLQCSGTGAEAPAGEDGSAPVGSDPGMEGAESFPGLFSGNHINSLFLKHQSLDVLVTAGWPILTDTTTALEGYGD